MGTIINTAAIIAGGLIGHFVGMLFKEKQQDALIKACGVSVLFIAIAGAMEGMLSVEEGAIHSGKGMFVVLCLALGTVAGELIGIEEWFERFGEWLKARTGNSGDRNFVNAFVTASLTVCIGAMAIVGAIQDGILGDYSTLAVKSVLDFIIIAVMTSSMGKGCAFSAIPILAFEGSITLLALDRAGHDRRRHRQSVPDRVHSDLLCRPQPGLGQKSEGRQLAARRSAGSDHSLPAVVSCAKITGGRKQSTILRQKEDAAPAD